jgi:hypothetical protein
MKEEMVKGRIRILLNHLNYTKEEDNHLIKNNTRYIRNLGNKKENYYINLINKTLNSQNITKKLKNLLKDLELPPTIYYFTRIFLLKEKKNFNMIEILIAISIIVTFSGLTGA